MALFSLEKMYRLNVSDMDRQHQQIFDCMAAIEQVLAGSGTVEDMEPVLDALEICCKTHFFDEERLMENRSFPTTVEHKIQHDLFIRRLDLLKTAGTSLRNTDQVIMLRDWFLNHILSEDMRYAEFFLKKN